VTQGSIEQGSSSSSTYVRGQSAAERIPLHHTYGICIMFTWKHKNTYIICSAGEPLYRTIQLSDQNQSRRSQGPVSCQTKTIYPSRKRRYEDPVKPRTYFDLLHPESSGKDIKRVHRVCLVRENFFFGFGYCSTVVYICQLMSNHGLIRLKRFVSWFSTKLYN
jgi:hypothetical protein